MVLKKKRQNKEVCVCVERGRGHRGVKELFK
jgi:hypothetical protein